MKDELYDLRLSLAVAETTKDAALCPTLRRMCDEGMLTCEFAFEGNRAIRYWFANADPSAIGYLDLPNSPTERVVLELFIEGILAFRVEGSICRIMWLTTEVALAQITGRQADHCISRSHSLVVN